MIRETAPHIGWEAGSTSSDPAVAAAWLADFQRRHGRPLRILHIGNIANNAYRNASIQRRHGIAADVVCYDYYHVMGCPEWEDADLRGSYDAFYPDWWAIETGDWARPAWFVQGPLALCLDHLRAMQSGDGERQRQTRLALIQDYARVLANRCEPAASRVRDVLAVSNLKATLRLAPELSHGQGGHGRVSRLQWLIRQKAARYREPLWRKGLTEQTAAGLLDPALRRQQKGERLDLKDKVTLSAYAASRRVLRQHAMPERLPSQLGDWPVDPAQMGVPRLLSRYLAGLALSNMLRVATGFGGTAERRPPAQKADTAPFLCRDEVLAHYTADNLSLGAADLAADIEQAAGIAAPWRDVLDYYDVVQGYSVDGAIPLFAGVRRFTTYEHGTIREIPFEASARGRLCRFTYKHAPRVFITNTDVLPSADRIPIALDRRVYIPHAFDDSRLMAFRAQNATLSPPVDGVHFFAPTRHHWETFDPSLSKGNDVFLRGAALAAATGAAFRLTLVDWGQHVPQSKALIERLGMSDRVHWVGIMNRTELWRVYLEAHAVVDQFSLPALGGVGYEALTLGARLMTNLDRCALTRFFGACPPALIAATPEDVAERIAEVIADPTDRAGLGAAGATWAARYHSTARIHDLQIGAYRELIDGSIADLTKAGSAASAAPTLEGRVA